MIPLAASTAAVCPAPVGRTELEERAAAVETAWMAQEHDAFAAAAAALAAALPCVREVLARADVAAWWRARAFVAFVDGDTDAVEQAVAASREALPTYVLPELVVGLDHPFRRTWDAYVAGPAPAQELPEPAEGWLQIDGRRSSVVPARPYVLQRLDGTGAVVETLVAPPVPAYAQKLPPPPPPEPAPEAVAVERHRSRGLLAAGAGTAAAGGGAMIAAGVLRANYLNALAADGQLAGTARANQALGYSGIALTVAAGWLGVGAVVVGEW